MSVSPEYLHNDIVKPSFFKRLTAVDWIWALLVVAGAGFVYARYSALMDAFERGILFATAPMVIALGWSWKPIRTLTIVITFISLLAVSLYGNDLARGDINFFLKYMLSSQSAFMWMSALFVMATAAYWLGLFLQSDFTGRVASALTWSASTMGLVGMMVRWRESYLISPDVGHIPVSNLYEVFILFAVITGLLYLYYEGRYQNRALGAFALTVISGSVAFLLWYTFERQAHEIQPLVPALQSYWMKIHVPANFVGYGAFALAAMLGIAYLAKDYRGTPEAKPVLIGTTIVTSLLVLVYKLVVAYTTESGITVMAFSWALAYSAAAAPVTMVILWVLTRERVAHALPSVEQMDDIMYKGVALGFAFFTVATVLGAMWAAEAWGGYWSWDPKETWALIVWLNYAAWLHMRLTKGWRGRPMAWWAIIGLIVTLFAFVGVNMFLAGLHSYGTL